MPKTIVLGVSGPSGAGKDLVCQFLMRIEPRAKVFEADKVAHHLYRPKTAVWRQLVKHFGRQILLRHGSIDRKKLGSIVFRSAKELAFLNRVMHPRIRAALGQELVKAKSQGVPLVIINAALLHTIMLHDLVDFSWVMWAPEKLCILRLARSKKIPLAEVLRRVKAQRPIPFRCSKDIVLKNTGSRADLAKQVRRAYNKMMARWQNSA